MYFSLRSAIVSGIEGVPVDVEVDVSNGLPGSSIVGLPDVVASESRERVRSALQNAGFTYPLRRITVNLAPAHIKKRQGFFDLAIALGILGASGQIVGIEDVSRYIFVGELSLNGKLLPLRGMLTIASMARALGKKLVMPAGNIGEARLVEGVEYRAFEDLRQVAGFFAGAPYREPDASVGSLMPGSACEARTADISEVAGQAAARRAIEIAAAGGHAILFRGAPGSGKTMLANCIPGILPPMSFDERLEVSKLYSVAGLLGPGELVSERAFRSPHHTVSEVAMVGGGSMLRPGEVSLAHNGVLFLDELTEYRRPVLEALREPLGAGKVTIARASGSCTYPARFMFVAACNPCPCGNFGDWKVQCTCAPTVRAAYAARLSGPLLDRIDIQIDVRRVEGREIREFKGAEPSAAVAARVAAAREIQLRRYGKVKDAEGPPVNAFIDKHELEEHCRLGPGMKDLVCDALERFDLSMRSYGKILRVARTIADIDGRDAITRGDLLEAIQYRVGAAK